jgi:hypothetical protein
MPLYTSEYLKSLARRRTLNESRIKLFSANEKEEFDIFLSHSFLDKEEVIGLYLELTDLGYKVYVDWIIDKHLDRSRVTKETAELIRKRLKFSKSLLLAVSTNAALSKWMPWELGYVDGNTGRCAIIPVAQSPSNTFNRAEYLLLYPYIDKTNLNSVNDKIWVNRDSKTYNLFDQWFHGEEPYYRG